MAASRVKVGDVAHPMEEKHYIQWIEMIADGKTYRQFLNPGEMPEAFFAVYAAELTAREYCNLHGLWKTTQKSGCLKSDEATAGQIVDVRI